MTFDDIAIHDGCVAGLEFVGHLVLCFDRSKILPIDGLDGEPGLFQVLDPGATAASGRRLVDRDQFYIWRNQRSGRCVDNGAAAACCQQCNYTEQNH